MWDVYHNSITALLLYSLWSNCIISFNTKLWSSLTFYYSAIVLVFIMLLFIICQSKIIFASSQINIQMKLWTHVCKCICKQISKSIVCWLILKICVCCRSYLQNCYNTRNEVHYKQNNHWSSRLDHLEGWTLRNSSMCREFLREENIAYMNLW